VAARYCPQSRSLARTDLALRPALTFKEAAVLVDKEPWLRRLKEYRLLRRDDRSHVGHLDGFIQATPFALLKTASSRSPML